MVFQYHALTPGKYHYAPRVKPWLSLVYYGALLSILVMACSGLLAIVAYLLGLIKATPHYSDADIRAAGWIRRPLILDSPHHFDSSKKLDAFVNQQVTMHDFQADTGRVEVEALHLLILCPLRNAAHNIDHFFTLADALEHPKENTSLAFLLGDEEDDTGDRLRELVKERTRRPEGQRYRHITLLRKDFSVEMPNGPARHALWLQNQRRSIMARARTYLVTSTLEPSVDWVLWLDADILLYPPTLFSDLLRYGRAGASNRKQPTYFLDHDGKRQKNPDKDMVFDIIVPNVIKRIGQNTFKGYDQNNWAETPTSINLKSKLRDDEILIEGNIFQHMKRLHLADTFVRDNVSTDPTTLPMLELAHSRKHSTLYDPKSPAYIGKLLELDGVGGVAALVRADVHRMGAVFPAWIFEHQLETEAFAVLAKKLGARIAGLSNYIVYHP